MRLNYLTCSVKLFIIFPNLLFIVVLKPERMRPRTRLRHILCDNSKMVLKRTPCRAWTEFMWLRIEISDGLL
jgi:hypothetical protein